MAVVEDVSAKSQVSKIAGNKSSQLATDGLLPVQICEKAILSALVNTPQVCKCGKGAGEFVNVVRGLVCLLMW